VKSGGKGEAYRTSEKGTGGSMAVATVERFVFHEKKEEPCASAKNERYACRKSFLKEDERGKARPCRKKKNAVPEEDRGGRRG